jgi:hypothetical protein
VSTQATSTIDTLTKPSTGAYIAGKITVRTTSCQSTPIAPDRARAAPMRPPISACDAVRLLESPLDVLPAGDRDGVLAGAEEAGDGLALDAVALVLEPPHLLELRPRAAEAVEPGTRHERPVQEVDELVREPIAGAPERLDARNARRASRAHRSGARAGTARRLPRSPVCAA